MLNQQLTEMAFFDILLPSLKEIIPMNFLKTNKQTNVLNQQNE